MRRNQHAHWPLTSAKTVQMTVKDLLQRETTTALSLARHKYILYSRGERWRQLRGSSLKSMRLHNGRNKIAFRESTPKILALKSGQIARFLTLVMMFVRPISTRECWSFTCASRTHHSRENQVITGWEEARGPVRAAKGNIGQAQRKGAIRCYEA